MTKLNEGPSSSNNHEGTHMKKALRATLILFPLLGITNLLFFINPKNGTHDKIYMLFNATMQSSQVNTTRYLKTPFAYVWVHFQGIFLAILYCFLNSEVQEVIRRQFNRLAANHDIYRAQTEAGETAHFRCLVQRKATSPHEMKLAKLEESNQSEELVPLNNGAPDGAQADNNGTQCKVELNGPEEDTSVV